MVKMIFEGVEMEISEKMLEKLLLGNENDIIINENGKRFGLLLCAQDSEYLSEKYGGFFGIFTRMFSEEGDNWDVFNVVKNEFPYDEELKFYDGFVITGSCNDAHANDDWICNLVDLVKKLDCLKKKVLGICFGHQILGRSLGGKIGRASSGWDIGPRTVHFSPSTYKVWSHLQIPSTLDVIKCHQDEILELPAKVEILGESNKTSIEIFRYGDHLLGIQGHPEYNPDILAFLIGRLRQKDLIEVTFAEEMLAKCMELREPELSDREAWRKLCIGFLKGTLS